MVKLYNSLSMTSKKYHILLALVLFFSSLPLVSFGQISEGGEPFSFTADFTNKMAADNPLSTTVLPAMDVSDLEAANADGGGLQYYAKAYPVNFGLQNSGQWINLENGDRIWRLQILAKEAKSLEALYDDFYLPEGGKLFIYNESGSFLLGAFTHNNNRDNGLFATSIVPGDVITFEYYEPAAVLGQGRIHINRLDYGFDDGQLPNKNFGSSESCNINVNCSQGDNWQDEKRGVARISIRTTTGAGWCSGSLINNTDLDARALFLSAWHCHDGGSGMLYNQWVFYFNFESVGCANGSDPGSQSITGCSVLTDNEAGDMLLLELNATVPSSYNPFYNGWNRSNTPNSNPVTGIHHPAGDIKKISVADDGYYSNSNALTFTGGSEDLVIPAGNLWGCIWTEGTTEGGSSGSPLFDSNGYILGQLTGGSSSCSTPDGNNWYGKISVSWGLLQPYLDPSNSGVNTLNGSDGVLPYANNVRVTEVSTELSSCQFTNSTQVDVTVENFGQNVQTSIPVSYELRRSDNSLVSSGSTVITGINLAVRETVVTSFNVDMSTPGDYIFTATANLAGDENADDDEVSENFSNEITTQGSSNLNIDENTSSAVISWASGNGVSRLLLLKEGSNFTSADLPVDGVSYSANSVFGLGSSVGSAYVVYKGANASATISNLTAGTTYYVAVIDFSCVPEDYLLSDYLIESFVFGQVTSLSVEEELKLDVFPNPASEEVFINLPNYLSTDKVQVVLSSINGQVIKSEQIRLRKDQVNNPIKWNVRDVKSGLYQLQVITNQHTFSNKLIIKR